MFYAYVQIQNVEMYFACLGRSKVHLTTMKEVEEAYAVTRSVTRSYMIQMSA